MQTYFQKQITDKGLVPAGFDPRHIEGFIRLQYATLGHLDWPTIRREVKIALDCIRADKAMAERNALSYGL
jgi:hypothetical protein